MSWGGISYGQYGQQQAYQALANSYNVATGGYGGMAAPGYGGYGQSKGGKGKGGKGGPFAPRDNQPYKPKGPTGNPQVPNMPQGPVMTAGLVSPGMAPIKAKPAAVLAAEAKKQAEEAKGKQAAEARGAAKAAKAAANVQQQGEKRKPAGDANPKPAKQQWQAKERTPKNIVPEDFKLDETKVYTGVVQTYWKMNGYGFVVLDEKSVAPEDKVFVFWSNINSADRFPFLHKEQKVQFTLMKEKDKKGNTTLRAEKVSEVGGAPISLQDEGDAKKEFVVSQASRFKGSVKFFHPSKGFGYINVTEGQPFGGEEVPKELRVEIAEVNAGGATPGYLQDIQVEFGIWKNKKSIFKAHNMTGPSGATLPTLEQSPVPSKEELDAARAAKK